MIRKIINNQYFLLPGDMIVTKKSLKISTVLGSCVSVCLFDPVRIIAGMNHYMLPVNDKLDPDHLKYGNTSLQLMLSRMISAGSETGSIKAFVAGGSSMFSAQTDRFNIGKNNVIVAQEFLNQNSIQTVTYETGGILGRKIVFDTSNGEFICKPVRDN